MSATCIGHMPLHGRTQGVSPCALNCTISPESQLLTLSLLWRQTPPSRKQGFRFLLPMLKTGLPQRVKSPYPVLQVTVPDVVQAVHREEMSGRWSSRW